MAQVVESNPVVLAEFISADQRAATLMARNVRRYGHSVFDVWELEGEFLKAEATRISLVNSEGQALREKDVWQNRLLALVGQSYEKRIDRAIGRTKRFAGTMALHELGAD